MTRVVVPIGPQHPALKEPVNFRVVADGERIVELESTSPTLTAGSRRPPSSATSYGPCP